MTKTRLFNGKRYKKESVHHTKTDADKHAELLRGQGWYARIVKVGDTYVIYDRGKRRQY